MPLMQDIFRSWTWIRMRPRAYGCALLVLKLESLRLNIQCARIGTGG
jgi:hypothetical protein